MDQDYFKLMQWFEQAALVNFALTELRAAEPHELADFEPWGEPFHCFDHTYNAEEPENDEGLKLGTLYGCIVILTAEGEIGETESEETFRRLS